MSSWKKEFDNFCARSSIHGLSRLSDQEGQKNKCARAMWLLIIVALMIILVLAASTISIEVFSRKKVYTSMTMASNETMAFPDIHICDSSFFNRQRLLGELNSFYFLKIATKSVAIYFFILTEMLRDGV